MAYDESKNITLKEWRHEDLFFGVYQYDGGEPKFQIGPRVIKTSKGENYVKAGRLSLGETEAICSHMEEIKKAMKVATKAMTKK